MKKKSAAKVFQVIVKILVGLLVAFSIFMMIFTIASVTLFDKDDISLFGYKFYIVQSDSMKNIVAEDGTLVEGYFDVNDLIVVKEVDPATLKEGDIITFISIDQKSGTNGMTISHMIREPKLTVEGDPGFQTFGTSTGSDDPYVVGYNQIKGQYQFKVPFAGPFFRFLKDPSGVGYITCILIPFLLLILSQAINFVRLFRQYRREQLAEIQAERERVEEERLAAQKELAEAQKMMAELLAMKEMLAKQAAGTEAASTEEKAPAEEAATTEEAATAEETATTEETATAEETATVEEVATTEETATAEEAATAEETATTEEATPAEETETKVENE